MTLAGRLVLLVILLSACGGRRILGFGDAETATLLVRHNEAAPIEIVAGDASLGIAQPGGFTCFTQSPTGTMRLEARSAPEGALIRATRITLPPDQPLLWDIDHNQILSGRVHERLCATTSTTTEQ